MTRNLKTIRAEVSKNQKHLCDFIQLTKTAIIKTVVKIKLSNRKLKLNVQLIEDTYWIVK